MVMKSILFGSDHLSMPPLPLPRWREQSVIIGQPSLPMACPLLQPSTHRDGRAGPILAQKPRARTIGSSIFYQPAKGRRPSSFTMRRSVRHGKRIAKAARYSGIDLRRLVICAEGCAHRAPDPRPGCSRLYSRGSAVCAELRRNTLVYSFSVRFTCVRVCEVCAVRVRVFSV